MGTRNPILVVVLNPTVVMMIVAVAMIVFIGVFLFTRTKRRRAAFEAEKGAKRVGTFDINPLNADEVSRYADDWRLEQSLFGEDPKAAVRRADSLVQDVMIRRGYPVSDFNENADEIAADQPRVVENYRIAHEIALQDERGETNPQDLHKAMVSYNALLEDLLDHPVTTPQEVRK